MEDEQAWEYYKKVHNWLTNYTPGENFKKGIIKHYHVNVWQPIQNLLKKVINKKNRTEEEEFFVKECSYYGETFRVHSCDSNQRKFVYETKCLQSWSKRLEGIDKVNIHGDIILIMSHTDRNFGTPAICVFGFLMYLFTFKRNFIDDRIEHHYPQLNPTELKRYEEEFEIIMPLAKDNINRIIKIKGSNIFQWEKEGKLVAKENWMRKS